jgi:imidazolonepropionase-like amidohydrolase
VRRVFEVDGLFDGVRTMTNAAIVIDSGDVTWVGQRNATPKTPTGERSEVVGLEKAGHIGAGCWADLVFVDGDPLKDLGVLRPPQGVYVRGAAAVS